MKMHAWGKGILAAVLIAVVYSIIPAGTSAAEKWPGVDESVVEKYAKEHGREAHEPLINTDQGDLLLFVFLVGGSVGGFAAGYYWRQLMVETTPVSLAKERISS